MWECTEGFLEHTRSPENGHGNVNFRRKAIFNFSTHQIKQIQRQTKRINMLTVGGDIPPLPPSKIMLRGSTWSHVFPRGLTCRPSRADVQRGFSPHPPLYISPAWATRGATWGHMRPRGATWRLISNILHVKPHDP